MGINNTCDAAAVYECAICGARHTDVASRATCELACAKRKEEEKKKAAEAKKKAEQKARMAEVDAAYAAADKLMEAYIEDYGFSAYSTSTNDEEVDDFLNFLKFFM